MATESATLGHEDTPQSSTSGLIDCDIHPWPTMESLARFLPERRRRQFEVGGMRVASEVFYVVRPRRMGVRLDAFPPSGGRPGSDPEYLREQLLDQWNVEIGILNPQQQMMLGNQPPDLAHAITRAINECMAEDWLDTDPRLRASICIPLENGELAAEEIRRWADEPRFVQVLGNIRNREPLGNRRYWRIYEAAVEHDLPVAFHVGGLSGNMMTGAGFPSYCFEDHSGYAQAFQAQAISLVVEGVFEHFPTLRIIWEEGGFSWAGPLAWRLDSSWSLLREEVPDLQRKPSEYLMEHFWYTTQPIEEPPKPEYLVQCIEQFGLGDRLLFSSDYPHWDFDAPSTVLPAAVPDPLRKAILGGNAKRLYGWE